MPCHTFSYVLGIVSALYWHPRNNLRLWNDLDLYTFNSCNCSWQLLEKTC